MRQSGPPGCKGLITVLCCISIRRNLAVDHLSDCMLSTDPQLLSSTQSYGARIVCWYKRRTSDRTVVSSNPSRSGGTVFYTRVHFVCWLLFGVCSTLCVTAVARKRPQSFCQKCRWQVTPKHAYTFDPTKSERAYYANVQALFRNL